MKRILLCVVLASLSFLFGCKKDIPVKEISTEYIVFGHAYGFCHGEQCIEIFKLEEHRVLEDTNDFYPDRVNFYASNFVALDDAAFNKVRDLREAFPMELLNEKESILGCPDCADQGGYYIEYKSLNEHRFWIIDTSKDQIPSYLHPFVDLVRAKIELLQN